MHSRGGDTWPSFKERKDSHVMRKKDGKAYFFSWIQDHFRTLNIWTCKTVGWCQYVIKGHNEWYQHYVSCSTRKFILAQSESNMAVSTVLFCFSISFSVFLLSFLSPLCTFLTFLSYLCASLPPLHGSLVCSLPVTMGLINFGIKVTYIWVPLLTLQHEELCRHPPLRKYGKNYLKKNSVSRSGPKGVYQINIYSRKSIKTQKE